MTTIAKVNPNPLRKFLAQQNSTLDTAQSLIERGGKKLAKVGSFGTNLFLLLSGIFVTGAFGLGKSLAPDHTFIDKFSLVGIIGGLITSIFSVIRMLKGYTSETKNEQQNVPEDNVSKELSKRAAEAVGKLSIESNNDFKLARKVLDVTKDDEVRKATIELLETYRASDSNGDFRQRMLQIADDGERSFKNGGGNNVPLLVSELRDRMSLLIAYIVGTADRNDGTISDGDKATKILKTDLNLEDLEDTEKQKKLDLVNLLPSEFVCVYQAARNYKLNHSGKDTSTQTIVTVNDTLKNNLTASKVDDQKVAEDELNNFINQYNYLKTLREAIKFVHKVETDKNAKKELVKKAIIVKSALITGLELDRRDSNVSLEYQLRKILDDGIGLSKKVDEVEKSRIEIQNLFQKENLKYYFENPYFTFTEILPASDTGLIKLQRHQS